FGSASSNRISAPIVTAPRRASSSHNARPIPEAAPVTMATRFSNDITIQPPSDSGTIPDMYCLLILFMLTAATLAAKPAVGPARGSLMVVGGGQMSPELWQEFISLAGGPQSPIVIIPTASGAKSYPADYVQKSALYRAGARNLTLLHTDDRQVSDS